MVDKTNTKTKPNRNSTKQTEEKEIKKMQKKQISDKDPVIFRSSIKTLKWKL